MFYEDRHGWKSRLVEMLGLGDNIKNFIEVDQTSSSNTECSLQSIRNKSLKKLFKLTVPFDIYSTISPITQSYKDTNRGYRYYDVLKPHKWTDVINDLFLKTHKLPCNFVYKRAKVSRDSSKSEKCIVFEALCKDCGSELEGWADSKPENGESLLISILTEDTIGRETSHTTKRQLKGYKRMLKTTYGICNS